MIEDDAEASAFADVNAEKIVVKTIEDDAEQSTASAESVSEEFAPNPEEQEIDGLYKSGQEEPSSPSLTGYLSTGVSEATVEERPEDAQRAEFDVQIDHSRQTSYGLDISEHHKGTKIERVTADGLVDQWNAQSQGTIVQAGDIIISVNGVTGDKGIRQEIGKAQVMTMKLQRKTVVSVIQLKAPKHILDAAHNMASTLPEAIHGETAPWL